MHYDADCEVNHEQPQVEERGHWVARPGNEPRNSTPGSRCSPRTGPEPITITLGFSYFFVLNQ